MSEAPAGLRAKDPAARIAAAQQAAAERDATAVDVLGLVLRADRVSEVRAAAATALGEIGQAGGGDALLRALGDPDAAVRAAVATALGVLGHARATVGLRRLQSDTDPAVRAAAKEALARIRGGGATARGA